MKIAGSAMAFASDSHNEEMGLTLEEKNQTRTARQTRTRLQETQGLPQLIVDRVTISQSRAESYQSQYSFTVTGKSKVMTEADGETVSFEQKASMERLIGGVMDRAVIIKSIRGKTDIDLSEPAAPSLSGDQTAVRTMGGSGTVPMWEMSVKNTELHFEEETVRFKSSGEVITEDGRMISFSLDMSLDRAFFSRTQQETLVQRWQERVDLTDPLVISMDGKAPQLTDATFEFDLNNDGKIENISFASPGSGFLAFDKNGDHIINNGSELFGPGTGNGFMELSAFDEDQNNWIDENDAVFSQLSVWTRDEKGQSRLISLKDAGIGAISLQNAATEFDITKADNEIQGRLKRSGVFLFENGKVGSVQEMDLALQMPDQEKAGEKTASRPGLILPGRPAAALLVSRPMTAVPAPQPTEGQNPLQELLEQVKKLKEKMERLYDSANSGLSRKKPYPSGHGRYDILNQDPQLLMFDRKGQARSQSRRV